MIIFDSHIHLFSERVIRNVQQKYGLVQRLRLQTRGAVRRTRSSALAEDMRTAGVAGALLLPTANLDGVRRTNRECIDLAARTDFLTTAGTLHPDMNQVDQELAHLRRHRVRAIKLCSFSQGFVLNGPGALAMFDAIEAINVDSVAPFAVILDTLRTADHHFGTRPEFNTSPEILAQLADRFSGINFIGAHMGGLDASPDELRRHLMRKANLYLDTSNAAHTLTKKVFCDLATHHGPGHILFGTDWPWFIHAAEIQWIADYLDAAGFTEADKRAVFYQNSATLFGLKGIKEEDG